MRYVLVALVVVAAIFLFIHFTREQVNKELPVLTPPSQMVQSTTPPPYVQCWAMPACRSRVGG